MAAEAPATRFELNHRLRLYRTAESIFIGERNTHHVAISDDQSFLPDFRRLLKNNVMTTKILLDVKFLYKIFGFIF